LSIQEKIEDVSANALARAPRPKLALVPQAAPHPAAHSGAKRALDLVVAVPALILLSPAMLVIAALIALDFRGPVLFRQTRTGLNGRLFDIFKFRTMNVCENGARIEQVHRNDPRVTRLGRLLRRTSVDELPQLINVIKGEMSLIGPRPHALAHDRLYTALIENYALRQCVKPGISGWAQVNGHRGETPALADMRARVEHDLWYARHQNFALDVKILVRTAFEIFRRNAW
jgi:lipopolysaccharide/colanic/teichoic acid biosynthesis glycosyltransferase